MVWYAFTLAQDEEWNWGEDDFRGVNWSVIYFCFAIDFRKKWRRLLEVTSGSRKGKWDGVQA